MREPPHAMLKTTALAAAAAGAFFFLASADLALRSREAVLEAEKYERWRDAPALKAAYYDALFRERTAAPSGKAGNGGPDREAAARAADLLAAERDLRISESSAKMTYLWYKTAAEDFTAPFNPWAARARAKLPAALGAWRAELAAKNIKAESWMLE